MEQSCQSSSQNINTNNTQICFSINTYSPFRWEIMHTQVSLKSIARTSILRLTLPMIESLGINFGILQSRWNISWVGGSISARAWKDELRVVSLFRVLSLTFTFSMLKFIPLYVMSWKSYERGLFGGDTKTIDKAHLINWEVYCMPKDQGGLGIKQPQLMNESF